MTDSMVLKVAVIGGGPAGLTTLKHLLEARSAFPGATIDACLFEAHHELGGVFSQQIYEDAELVSSKYLTAFSDFRLPEHEPDFLTPQRYLRYLKRYVDVFGLRPHIRLGTPVNSIRAHPTQPGHILHVGPPDADETSDPGLGEFHFHAVAICTGLNHTPYMPAIRGLSLAPVPGAPRQGPEVLHAKDFKTRAQFGADKTVLVLGAGETAMDIAALAVTAPTRRVVLSHRDGFTYQPKIVPTPLRLGGSAGGPRRRQQPNKPLDCSAASLFDTAYVPPALQRGPLLWAVYDFFVKNMALVISGTRAGVDQWAGGIGPARFHADAVIFCKSDRALPYISEQYRSTSTLNRWRTWLLNVPIQRTGGRKIDLAPWPSHFDQDGVVHFQRNGRPESRKMEQEAPIRPDMVIYATGYQRSFPFLPQNDPAYPTLNEASTRGIYRDIEDGIAYIGFVRPALGAIPPLAEMQAQRWIHALVRSRAFRHFFAPFFTPPPAPGAAHNAVAPYELDYALHHRGDGGGADDDSTAKRAVDMDAYAYQLALDMGAAPAWWWVGAVFGWQVLVTWALGPNFPTKFRLVGPWASYAVTARAARLMRRDGELGRVVRRTGGGIFLFTYTVIPLLIFAPVCIVLNIYACIAEAATALSKAVVTGRAKAGKPTKAA